MKLSTENKTQIYSLLLDDNKPEEVLIGVIDTIESAISDIVITDARIYESKDGILNCKLGIYEIFWDSGGSSVATIGMKSSGERWFSPSNWSSGSCDLIDFIDGIMYIKLLYTQRH